MAIHNSMVELCCYAAQIAIGIASKSLAPHRVFQHPHPKAPIAAVEAVGFLELKLQSTDGNVLSTRVEVCVAPKPEKRQKRQAQDITVEMVFSAPGGDPDGKLRELFAETSIGEFSSSLAKFRDALPHLDPEEATYWGARHDRDSRSYLRVEVNAGNPELQKLLASCRTTEERISAKQRYCQDVVLDCYQHSFKLDEVPEQVWSSIQSDDEDEARKASEFYLNHDKAVRFAARERERTRK